MCNSEEKRIEDNYRRFCRTVYKNQILSEPEKSQFYNVAEQNMRALQNGDSLSVDIAKSNFARDWILYNISNEGKETKQLLSRILDKLETKRSLKAGEALAALIKVLFDLFRKT